jgi:hypothetical protein
VAAAVTLAVAACAGADDAGVAIDDGLDGPGELDGPAGLDGSAGLDADSTWQWQLQGELDTSYDVDVYDVDLFDTVPAVIAALHADGRIVVCYFSAGSYEGWRPDADGFAEEARGDILDGFDDERWLDVRDPSVRATVEGRLDLAVERGCDGVEPDNVAGYANRTGFPLSGDDQLDFNRFIAAAASQRDLLVGLKNDLEQIDDLVDVFDFAVNEQCHEFDECEAYAPFLDGNKPVFNAEYDEQFIDDSEALCRRSMELGLRTMILPLDLDNSFRISCDE